ncbi:MAG: PD-(D/E)XK nuclease family protein [Candidatus Krumholzibacteriota bacterium]
MPPRICHIPFSDNLLRRLAADLPADLPGTGTGNLTGALVILPSSRACRTLQHELLDESGRDTLLLPRIMTVTQWADEMAAGLGLTAADLPDDRVRPLILARKLMTLPWLRDNRESAPGLAAEFIGLFDEIRLHRRELLLLDPRGSDRVLEMSATAEAEIIAGDLRRIHEVWGHYRRLVPRDSVDRLADLAQALAAGGVPGQAPDLVAVAGFGRIDPVRAELLRAALDHGGDSRLYLPAATSRLSRLFQATWSPDGLGTDPLAPARRTEFLLTGQAPEVVTEQDIPTLKERLDALNTEGLPEGRPAFMPCGDTEAESRLAAHHVAEILSRSGEHGPSIAVAVGDPKLAARITAQLRDAGIDSDNTHGQALSSLPAGLLLRFMLRAALTDLRPEPLLEVLTHPYVQLPVAEGSHGTWTLRLERMFRRNQGPPGGLAGLRRQAADRDQSALNIFRKQGQGMVEFVEAVAGAFAPLLEMRGSRARNWDDLTDAVTKVWTALAPDHPLGEKMDRPDVTAAARLLDTLRADATLLPQVDLADFTADLGQLLSGENVPPHRARNLPVLVTGLVEARLESYDHLIIAGLRDGVFPARPPRPLLLGGGIRDRLDLPGWRDALSRDAELFLRLLHNAPEVLLTWTTEEEGQPVLPSPFVSRLQLALQPELPTEPDAVLWRREEVPWPQLETATADFLEEDPAPPALAKVRHLTRLSWSALRQWRECPYRFLLERGFALRKEEEVQEEFGRLEYGSLVHEALADFLAPDGPGYAALAGGDRTGAEEVLTATAREKFAPGANDLPLRHLWLDSFLRSVPPVIAHEMDRFQEWRPVALEEQFEMPLADLAGWISREAEAVGWDPQLPDLSGHAADIVLRGTVDRIDRRQDGTGALCVIDYKTGRAPSARKVQTLDEMQVLLYAAAVEAGRMAVSGPVVEGFYYPVKEDKPGRPHKAHLDCADGEGRLLLLQGAARLVELAVSAGDPAGCFPLIPRETAGEGEASLPCEFCELRGACRLEERNLPPGTDRKLDKLVNSKDRF